MEPDKSVISVLFVHVPSAFKKKLLRSPVTVDIFTKPLLSPPNSPIIVFTKLVIDVHPLPTNMLLTSSDSGTNPEVSTLKFA